MTASVDAATLIRHLTGDPHKKAARATAHIRQADELILTDVVVAEMVNVLRSAYDLSTGRIAELMRSIVAFPAIRTADEDLLLRSFEVYEAYPIDYSEAYLIASAEQSGVGTIVSFNQALDQIPTIDRIEP